MRGLARIQARKFLLREFSTKGTRTIFDQSCIRLALLLCIVTNPYTNAGAAVS